MFKLIVPSSFVVTVVSIFIFISSQKSPAARIVSKHEQGGKPYSPICKLHLNHQQPIKVLKMPTSTSALFFGSDGQTLALTDRSAGSGITLLNITTGNRENFMPNGWMGEVSFSPDGKYMAFGAVAPFAYLMNLQDKSIIELKGHGRRMGRIQFSSDSQFIATTSLDNKARIFNTKGDLQATISGIPRQDWGDAVDRDPQITNLSWSHSGQLLIAGSGKQFTIWDSKTHKQNTLSKESILSTGSSQQVNFIQFIPNREIRIAGARIGADGDSCAGCK